MSRPNYSKNDKVTLCSHVSAIPAYAGKPFVGCDTVLSVSHLTGRGSKRDPWRVVLTDGEHFWHMDPADIQKCEGDCSQPRDAHAGAAWDEDAQSDIERDDVAF